jgi:predicted porin
MKKTLIALAVLAASGASFAQVTLYGAVSTSFQSNKVSNVVAGVGTDTRNDGFLNGALDGGDRWGMKGTEDLGGGLKATFQLESRLNTADGTGGAALFNRQSHVGLAGSFGSVRFGRTTTSLLNVVDNADVFATQGLTTVGVVGAAGGRFSNGMFYTTPSFSGFTATVEYGTVDTGTSAVGGNNSTRNSGLSFAYEAGPLYAAIATGVQDTSVGAVDAKNDGQAIGATYDFGAAKLFFAAAKSKDQANVGINTFTENADTNIGVAIPFGAITLMGAIGRNSRTNVAAGAEVAATTGSGADWVLGATYSMSKRTTAFIKTGTVDKFDFGATGTTANRTETSGTAIGLRHKF